MARRIYAETVKHWAVRAGIPATSIIVLYIVYLNAINAIIITGHSGDMVCAGTEKDPCYAYINFTVKNYPLRDDSIYIYPIGYDPYGRNTPFSVDKELKDWKIYRSWGKGWREIKLNETCKGTWCGGKPNTRNKFSFVFREGRNYTIKIVGYKRNPKETIKWSFWNLDPVWKGINKETIFPRLISNKASLTYGEAIFEIYNPTKENLTKGVLNFSFYKLRGTPVKRITLEINYSKELKRPIYEKKLVNQTCFDNITKESYDCSYFKNEIKDYESYFIESWKELDQIPPGLHKIKLRAYWDAHLGRQQIEWIPYIKIKKELIGFKRDLLILKKEWAWWNVSYDYKRLISINQTGSSTLTNFPYLVNGTNGFDLDNTGTQIVWAVVKNLPTTNATQYLYYNNNTDYKITNSSENAEISFEVEKGDAPSNNPSSVWDSNFVIVFHLNGSTTESTSNGYTCESYSTSAGKFGEGMHCSNADVDITMGSHTLYDVTFSGWIKDPSGYGMIAGKNGPGYDDSFSFGAKNSTTAVCFWDSADYGTVNLYSNISFTPGWNHIACTRGPDGVKIYVNGVLAGQDPRTPKIVISDSEKLAFCCDNDGDVQCWTGDIDEFRLSDVERSADWIKREYEMELSSLGSSLGRAEECSPAPDQDWVISDAQVCDGVEVTTGTGSIIITATGNLTLINGANVSTSGLNLTGTGDKVFICSGCELRIG